MTAVDAHTDATNLPGPDDRRPRWPSSAAPSPTSAPLWRVDGRARRPAGAVPGHGRSRPADRRASWPSRPGTVERYVRDGCRPRPRPATSPTRATGRFTLSPEHAFALTDESSPACVIGGFQTGARRCALDRPLAAAFRTGSGVGWGEHHHDLYEGCERFFRPGLPGQPGEHVASGARGVEEKLVAGGPGRRRRAAATAPRRSSWPGLPRLDVHRLRRPRGLHRRGARAGVRRRRRRPHHLRGPPRRDLAGTFDLVVLLRLPARHGRPGRRPDPRARGARPRRRRS